MTTPRWTPPDLSDRVAVVTGASRSLGKGIAAVLGECGATVYVTGRTTRASPRAEFPETSVEETADLVSARGGRGIAVCVDHTADDQVEALFERVRQEHGRLDVLVNNVWGGEEIEGRDRPIWEQPLSHWRAMMDVGARAHFVATHYAVPLMLARGDGPPGLIVNTAFSWGPGADEAPGGLYELAMLATLRLAPVMARQLGSHRVAAVSLSPGHMRNETMISPAALRAEYGDSPVVDTSEWGPQDEPRFGGLPGYMWRTESTQCTGRALALLAADRGVLDKSGRVLLVGDLACEYGFSDIDGRQPHYQEEAPRWKRPAPTGGA